jgi:acyl-CoA dehydrogenase
MPPGVVTRGAEIAARVETFVREKVISYEHDRRWGPHGPSAEMVDELRALARARGVVTPPVV